MRLRFYLADSHIRGRWWRVAASCSCETCCSCDLGGGGSGTRGEKRNNLLTVENALRHGGIGKEIGCVS